MKKALLYTATLLSCLLLAGCGEKPAEAPVIPSPTEIAEPTPAVQTAAPTAAPSPSPTPVPLSESAAGLQISELMAANRSYLPDEKGQVRDWIELQNTSDREISLAGIYLSDDPKRPLRAPLPERTLAPGEYLLLFCGGADGLSFSLKSEGEELLLSGEDGSVLQSLSYGPMEENASLCYENGEAFSLPFATPGYPNSEQGYEDYLRNRESHGALVIGEIVSYNDSFGSILNRRGEFFDWIELENVSETELDLGDYYISDKSAQPDKCPLPSRILTPGERVLIYCSGDSSYSTKDYIHVDFKLSSGETVSLSHREEGLSDLVVLPRVPGGGSYGRLPGQAGFFYLAERSPGAENSIGYRLVSPMPEPDLPDGIYENVQDLQVSLLGGGEIRYTLDGSVPTEKSPLYTGPISLEKTTVLRARCYQDGRLPSDCKTLSYIINEGHSLPVASVVCDKHDFQDLNTFLSDTEMEIPSTISLWEASGEDALFRRDCGMKLHGASSRKFPKKSYKLVFHDHTGGDIRADVFQRGTVKDYHALILRGRSVDHMYLVKDSLTALTALEVCDEPLTLDSRFCVLYVNGEYWGIYDLREAYCTQYAVDHTGSSPETVEIENNRGEHVRPEIYNDLRTRHVKDDAEYEAFCETFDVDAFARWLAIEAYFNNEDPDGNIRFIRGDGTDGKWTAALFDLDICLDTKYGDYSYFFSDNSEIAIIAAKLLRNEQFREALLRNASELYHRGLGSGLTRSLLQDMVEELEPEIPRNCARWNERVSTWETGKEALYKRLGDLRTFNWIVSLQRITKASDEEIESWFGDISWMEPDDA